MKTLLCLVLRSSFLGFSFLALLQSKIAFAVTKRLEPLSQVSLADLKFSIQAPAGWRVRDHYRGKTLVFEDPLMVMNKGVTFTRNITVAVQSGASPIDALEVKHLSEKLRREFGAGLSDFDIIEARIIKYRTKGDAILVFSTYTHAGVPMRQMHIFTSGSEFSALITYTDLQDSFEAPGAIDKVWGPMMSVEISGQAPRRFEGLMYSLSGVGFVMSAVFLGKRLRRRSSKAHFQKIEDALFDEDEGLEDDFEVEKKSKPNVCLMAETLYAGRIA